MYFAERHQRPMDAYSKAAAAAERRKAKKVWIKSFKPMCWMMVVETQFRHSE